MNEGDVVKIIADGRVSKVYNDEQCLVTVHAVDVPMLTSQLEQANDIGDMLIDALCIDGAHHKQWYLYQIAEKYGLEVGAITDDKGIAP